MNTEKAILAGGCFWGVEELIRHYPGVISTVVGYTVARLANLLTAIIGNHAPKVLAVTFDPAQLPYRKTVGNISSST